MIYSYPADAIPELRRVWQSTRFSKQEQVPVLPSDTILLELLNVAYHASFLTEEQRRIGFRLMYCGRDDLQRHPRYLGQKTPMEPIEFSTAPAFSVGELLRLAPATDPARVLICVGARRPDSAPGFEALQIWGLLDTGSSWWNYTQCEATRGYPPPNLLTISSIKPGHMSFSRQGVIILTLKNGRVTPSPVSMMASGPVAGFFEAAEWSMDQDVRERLRAIECDDEPADDLPKQAFQRYLQRILMQIRLKNHGGSVLVVPDHLDADDPRLSDRLNIKYPCVYDRAWKLIAEYAAAYHQVYTLNFPRSEDGGAVSEDVYGDISILKDELLNLEDAISDSVRFVASLSGVDGAVLLTDRLRVLGFGAEVTAVSPSVRYVRVADDLSGESGVIIPFDAYGTRHRSAFRFSSSYEESMSFVVSQDGGIKAIRRLGPNLVMWPDIDFGSLGVY